MVNKIGLAGFSSSGKSTSFRNLPPEETFFVLPSTKTFAWGGWKKDYSELSKDNPTGNFIRTNQLKTHGGKKGLFETIEYVNNKRPEIKNLIVEDITHFFNARTGSDAFLRDNGFESYKNLGADAIRALTPEDYMNLREDLTIIYVFHVDPLSDKDNMLTIKVPGKYVTKKGPETYFDYFFYTLVLDADEGEPEDRYKFVTNDDGYRPARTKYKCFSELYIPNDMNKVKQRIIEFEEHGE